MSIVWGVVRSGRAVAILLALSFVIAGGCTREPEPVFGGEPLSKWVKDLRDTSERTRNQAAQALTTIGVPAVPDLVKSLKDPSVEVRVLAGESLARIGPGAKATVSPLVAATKDQEPRVRLAALKALRALDAPADAVLPAVARLFEDDAACREEAAGFLRAIGAPAVPVFLKSAEGSDPDVRRLALRALVHMDPLPEAARDLVLVPLGENKQGYERFRWVVDGSVLVYLPGGSYTMGPNSWDTSQPAHTVTLSGFYVAEAEITWGQWGAYVAANSGAYNPGKAFTVTNNDPVHNVSWDNIQPYLTWAGLRLPTEAEWEYAARAGRTGDIYATSDGTISHNLANYNSGTGGLDTFTYTSPVKTFPANAFGLFDMSGNLQEWCADWYSSGYYATSPATDPTGPTSGSYRVIRGGAWAGPADNLRAAIRVYDAPGRADLVGLRPARSAP